MKPKSQGRAQIVRGNESKFTLHYEPVFFQCWLGQAIFFFSMSSQDRMYLPTIVVHRAELLLLLLLKITRAMKLMLHKVPSRYPFGIWVKRAFRL